VLDGRTYRVGRTPSDVADTGIYAETAISQTPDPNSTTTLRCDGSQLAVPVIGEATRIRVTSPDDTSLRIWVRDDAAPLPRVGTIYTKVAGSLHCTGPTSIEVSWGAG
jgi:hypothetical protein